MQKLLDESSSYGQVLEKLGMSTHGSNRITLRKVINKYDSDLTLIAENRAQASKKQLNDLHAQNAITLEDVLQNKARIKSNRFLQMLINAGYKNNKCECCGIESWMNKPITFHLHHINGNHNDNRIENLMVLCPNCHSQTDNYAGKNIKRPPVIKKEDEKKKALRGISEDGLRFYDGYGNYKELCPLCKKNFKNKDAEICRECYKKENKKPKIEKQEFDRILIECNYNFTQMAKVLNVNGRTISRWYKNWYPESPMQRSKIMDRNDLKKYIRGKGFTELARELQIDRSTIIEWCKKLNLPYKKREIDKYTDEEWELI